MRTPRPVPPTRRGGGVNTLIGYGWLKEAPKNLWPRGWDIKSRSALRKCVFMPVPPEAQAFIASLPPAKPMNVVPAVGNGLGPANRPATPQMRRKDPKKDARVFPAVSAEEVAEQHRRRLYAEAQARLIERPNVMLGHHGAAALEAPRAWYEDPLALGTLLILVPPIGLAALWASKRYSSDARWALTVMTGLTLCLASAVVVAVLMLNNR